jgi:hypothetical protein
MATTPNRKDAYMGAMKKTGGKPKSSMSAADPKSKPMTSKLAPTKSPRTKSAPVRTPQAASFTYREAPGMSGGTSTSKLAPASSKRPVPAGPAREVRNNQAKLDRAAGLGDDGPKNARFAPAKSPRTVPNPKKKQATYPGRTPYNYAV